MAFVQSVTGKRPDADKPGAESAIFEAPESVEVSQIYGPASFIPDIEALLADTSAAVLPKKPVQVARTDMRGDFQSEIRARVANFRAHQERFNREREAFGSATMAKVQASLREDSVPPRPGQ
jgi:hypothetical protein